mmetsp:Transcript_52410/g.139200  ORF Transcript_52410/g.139200 Transcript_52410/m.139200 type:complete len:343 (+) Transcript_52410:2251-3279(+)
MQDGAHRGVGRVARTPQAVLRAGHWCAVQRQLHQGQLPSAVSAPHGVLLQRCGPCLRCKPPQALAEGGPRRQLPELRMSVLRHGRAHEDAGADGVLCGEECRRHWVKLAELRAERLCKVAVHLAQVRTPQGELQQSPPMLRRNGLLPAGRLRDLLQALPQPRAHAGLAGYLAQGALVALQTGCEATAVVPRAEAVQTLAHVVPVLPGEAERDVEVLGLEAGAQARVLEAGAVQHGEAAAGGRTEAEHAQLVLGHLEPQELRLELRAALLRVHDGEVETAGAVALRRGVPPGRLHLSSEGGQAAVQVGHGIAANGEAAAVVNDLHSGRRGRFHRATFTAKQLG